MVSNAVALLEKIGQSSYLHALSGEQLERQLSSAGMEPAIRAAILQQHARQLETLIGASKNVCCLVHAPQDEEPEDGEPQKDDDEKVQARHASAYHGATRRVASAA